MKNLALMLFITVMFFSCEKDDFLIPNKEVPAWLKTKIRQDEQVIKDSPQSDLNYGAWKRYKWQDDYYFEYQNYVMFGSSLSQPISAKGDTLQFYVFDTTTDYYIEKCCKEFVWKATEFKDLPGM